MTQPQPLDLTNFFQCDQRWEEMPLCEKGRICEACNKVLIDFRELSDEAVADIHSDPAQTICGIYKKRQISIVSKNKIRPPASNWKVIGIGLAGILFSQNASSQQLAAPIEVNQTINVTKSLEKKASNHSEERIVIHGKVTDAESNEELIGANVFIKNHVIGASTDFNGNYSLDITEAVDSLSQDVIISYSYIGYSIKELVFSRNGDHELNVGMEEPEGGVSLDEIYVTGFRISLVPPPSFLQRVRTRVWHLLKSKVE